MSTVIMGCAAVSIDGFIADDNDEIGPLFDWASNGEVEWTWSGEPEGYSMHSTCPSVEFVRAVYPRIGCVVIGRRVFDLTDGWDGVLVMNVVPVVFGSGRPFFGAMGGGVVTLDNPTASSRVTV